MFYDGGVKMEIIFLAILLSKFYIIDVLICFKVVQTLNELAVDVNILEEQVVDVALLKNENMRN